MLDNPLLQSLFGGILIGLAAMLLLVGNGRIAGISGIIGGIIDKPASLTDKDWRLAFIAGMILAGIAYALFTGAAPAGQILAPLPLIVAGGLLVGFGTRLGAGCTSGHGVCGIARFSARSITATCTFMLVAGLTVFVMRHVLTGTGV